MVDDRVKVAAFPDLAASLKAPAVAARWSRSRLFPDLELVLLYTAGVVYNHSSSQAVLKTLRTLTTFVIVQSIRGVTYNACIRTTIMTASSRSVATCNSW